MKNLPKEKRERLILVVLLTVTVVAGIYYLVVKTQRNSLETLTREISEQKMKVAHAEQLIASVPKIRHGLDAANRTVAHIEEGMASGDMYAWVIQTVGRFGAERNVDIPQFSREVTAPVGMFAKFPYKAAIFNIRGNAYYHDLGQFLADFENSFPYFRVQNFEMEPATSSAANNAAAGGATSPEQEKLAFRLEIVTLINPNAH
jgi:Tfp pilus assembly protein PilO